MKKERVVVEKQKDGVWVARKEWRAQFEKKWHVETHAAGMSISKP